MHVLIVGSGGREHALGWAVSRSDLANKITTTPGNAGTLALGENIDLEPDEHNDIAEFCLEHKVDLVVVGPEAPLVDGIADVLRNKGINVFGPGAAGALLEGSKVFAKQFCDRHGIPTASYEVFENANKAHRYIDSSGLETCVVKADGLAAGKGAIVCDDPIEAHAAIDTILEERKFGDAGNQAIIEDRLTGFETTLLVITAGGKYIKLPYSQDHKRAYDGDKGPNTGGMGVFAPTPKVTSDLDEQITREIVEPAIKGLLKEGIEYHGCLYFGLMITEDGPGLIEFNCRFGDPEAQAVLPLIEGDFLGALYAASKGDLGGITLTTTGKKSLTVVLASEGYPGKYRKGINISKDLESLVKNPDLLVFHAGTTQEDDMLLTSGGRVVAITSLGDSFQVCREEIYGALKALPLKGLFYRTDIGKELVTVG